MNIMSTDYSEKYARQILNKILGFDLSTLYHKDRPDLQDFERKIGIEVTQDVYDKEMQCQRFWVKYEQTPYDKIPEKDIELYYKNTGVLKVSNNRLIGGTFGEEKDNNPIHLLKTIDKKLAKLNSGNYIVFENNMLYVFVETVSLFESYVMSIIETVNNTNYSLKYSRIILDAWFELYDCDIENQKYYRYSINTDLRRQIHTSISNDSISQTHQ